MKKALLLCLALVPAIAIAAGTDGKQDKKGNGLVCRESLETGSRLSSKRVCMTREQWEEYRRQTRQDIEQAQTRQWNAKGS